MDAQPLTKVNEVLGLLSTLSLENYSWNNRKAIRSGQEYEISDPENKDIYIYAQAVAKANLGKFNEALKLYQKINFNSKSIQNQSEIVLNRCLAHYAKLFYDSGDFEVALEKIKIIEKYISETKDTHVLNIALKIYFENNDFEKMKLICEKILNEGIDYDLELNTSSRHGNDIANLFLAFYYYNNCDNRVAMKYLQEISNSIGIGKITNDNSDKLLFFIMGLLALKIIPKLTENEFKFFKSISHLVEFYSKNPSNEIFFNETIDFDNEKYNILVENIPGGWFYGEIKEIADCRSQGKTIEELKDSLKQFIELCLETKERFFVPTKQLLKEIRENEENEVLKENNDNETKQWLNVDLGENLSQWEWNDKLPEGRPVKYVEGLGLVYCG